MSEVWRVFAAIDLTDEIRDRVAATAQLLNDAGWQARWVPQERMHMTVRFYGDVEVSAVEKLQEELRTRLAAQPAFELHVSRVGAFPAPNRPRVIWLGIDDPFEQLPRLKETVEEATGAAGLEVEPGPYKPHLTVGRLNPAFKVDADEAVEAFQEFGAYEPIVWVPEAVQLIRSKLARGGAQYTLIEEFSFGPPDGTISEPDLRDEPGEDVAETGDDQEPSEAEDTETSAAGSESGK